ncbi:thap domain-containing protein 4 isoform x2 [Limosa lapponica baueri]|uniref:Thap domain-containing protein 4 isoform x2 n=1 Tax=Limosa lapponica baueri TaxID=1758121 RepID=A0A2I0T2B7_LIMLA|nr:thap domain-containing protein 4 isoform x2 [Limosa lapponica baueri]
MTEAVRLSDCRGVSGVDCPSSTSSRDWPSSTRTSYLLFRGLVEVEEGEVNGQELSIASHSIARISFAKKPHVEQEELHCLLPIAAEIKPLNTMDIAKAVELLITNI